MLPLPFFLQDMKTTVIDDRTIKEPTRTVEYDYKMSFEGAVDPSLNCASSFFRVAMNARLLTRCALFALRQTSTSSGSGL